jgi:magnesium chelatase subunit I
MNNIRTIRELIESGYKERSVKVEMAENLCSKISKKEDLFPGIYGYEETVVPQLVHAILSGHNIVLLGEKGQAKSRIMRSLVHLLDEEIPILEGTEIPESPFHPITDKGKKIIHNFGENAPIRWMKRDERYGERLAPGAKIGDIIGDLDPSKIINGAPLSSEGAVFFGLLPRMNRGIFAVNELPDLDYLVQVSLFNILEESDVQIRGIPMRYPLDLVVCFTANPDDYNRSGKIISQLKDRIGSEIRTHYPKTRKIGLDISKNEIRLPIHTPKVIIPSFIEEIIEEMTIQARSSHLINQKSGVSARLSIANFEIAISSARVRALKTNESMGVVRMTDLGNLFSSSSGKMELDPYRDETVSEYQVLLKILDSAVRVVFEEYYPLSKHKDSIEEIAKQINGLNRLEISDYMPLNYYKDIVAKVPAIWDLLHEKGYDVDESIFISAVEFILEGLTVNQKLSRRRVGEISTFKSIELY